MDAMLSRSELLQGLEPGAVERLARIARRQSVPRGEFLFLLGDPADRLFVVVKGEVDICFPLSFDGTLRNVAVESLGPGSALGWSALVEPYRFTMSARSGEGCEVAAFHRRELLDLLDADARLGRAFMGRIAEVVSRRLLTLQAMWARELQRTLAGGLPVLTERMAHP